MSKNSNMFGKLINNSKFHFYHYIGFAKTCKIITNFVRRLNKSF